MQALLADFPEWDITARVDVIGKEKVWPGMGLLITSTQIIDDLQREFLPEEFRNFVYEGAKSPKRIDMNEKSYIFRRALR